MYYYVLAVIHSSSDTRLIEQLFGGPLLRRGPKIMLSRVGRNRCVNTGSCPLGRNGAFLISICRSVVEKYLLYNNLFKAQIRAAVNEYGPISRVVCPALQAPRYSNRVGGSDCSLKPVGIPTDRQRLPALQQSKMTITSDSPLDRRVSTEFQAMSSGSLHYVSGR